MNGLQLTNHIGLINEYRRHKFPVTYITSDNILCYRCKYSAARELNMLNQP